MQSQPTLRPELETAMAAFPDPTDKVRIGHMLQAIIRLEQVFNRFSLDELITQELPQSSTCRYFCILGAAAGVSTEFRLAHPQVNWQRWKNFGRYLVREYYRVNYQLLWQRWQQEVPALRQQLYLLRALAKPDARV